MIRLRFLLVSLASWLAIFYNMERVDERLNIASFVYVLILGMAIPLFLAPRIFVSKPQTASVAALGIYAVLKIYLGYPIAGGDGLLITFVEVAGILFTIFLLGQISFILIDFEEAIAKITINLLGIPPRLSNNDLEEVYREVRRARRYQHPLTLAVIKGNFDEADIDVNEVVQVIQRGMQDSFLQARLIKLLAGSMKESDIIVRDDKDLIIALPHATPDEARQLFERIHLQTLQWGLPLNVGVANFPQAGTTLHSLLVQAEQNISPVEIRPEHAFDPSFWSAPEQEDAPQEFAVKNSLHLTFEAPTE